jgi:hypothetical protein
MRYHGISEALEVEVEGGCRIKSLWNLRWGTLFKDLQDDDKEVIHYPLHSDIELLKFVNDHLEQCLKWSNIVGD